MTLKVSFFIDGQNLFHSLKKLGIGEAKVDWQKLFTACIGEDDTIEFAYWIRPKYIVEQVKLEKHSLKTFIQDREGRVLTKDELLIEYRDNHLVWWNEEKLKFYRVQNRYKKLVKQYSFMSLYQIGVLKVDTYNQHKIGEKGVDVGVAVKMVEAALTGECDRVVLLSGDSDYGEVVNLLKRHGKEVHCVAFGDSMSYFLRQNVHYVHDISKRDLRTIYKK